jgi:integrase
MAEDAIGDDAAAVKRLRRHPPARNDSRVRKSPRKVRVWSFEQMRAFARGGCPEVRAATKRPDSRWGRCYPPHDYEALLLTPGLTGLRLGEFLALTRSDFDGTQLALRFSAHEGKLIESSDQKNHERTVPVPPSLAELLEALPERDDTDLLFSTPTGKLWRERNSYRNVPSSRPDWTQRCMSSATPT